VSQGKNSVIVESMDNKSRMPVFISTQVSSLEDICIFTYGEDVPLKDVLQQIYQVQVGERVDENVIADTAELKRYMEIIVPEYDREKVHVSDMKKLFNWYNLLHEHGILLFDDKV